MTTVDSYNLKGQKIGTVKIPDAFVAKPNSKLLTQAVRVALSNKRRALASVMTRGDSGRTTAKVYRQKHTGRARHGSRNAPIYVGGGIAHGPTGQQNFRRDLPKQMSRLALSQAISLKADQKSLMVVENLEKITPKTKVGDSLLKSLKATDGKIIVATFKKDDNTTRAFGNLQGVTVIPFSNLNSYDVLSARTLVVAQEALQKKASPKKAAKK